MLPQILSQLQSGSARQHHVRHHQIDSALALQVKLHRLARVLRGHNFEACAFQNAAGRVPHEGLVLNQKDSAPPRLVVRLCPLLKSHTPSSSLLVTASSSKRIASRLLPDRRDPHQRLCRADMVGEYCSESTWANSESSAWDRARSCVRRSARSAETQSPRHRPTLRPERPARCLATSSHTLERR